MSVQRDEGLEAAVQRWTLTTSRAVSLVFFAAACGAVSACLQFLTAYSGHPYLPRPFDGPWTAAVLLLLVCICAVAVGLGLRRFPRTCSLVAIGDAAVGVGATVVAQLSGANRIVAVTFLLCAGTAVPLLLGGAMTLSAMRQTTPQVRSMVADAYGRMRSCTWGRP
jgi:hypothetical protein